jgi:hypothetical protein
VRQQGSERRRAVSVQGRGFYPQHTAKKKKKKKKISASSKASPSVNIWRISTSEVGKSI